MKVNQTGAGKHGDRRTKRQRDRSSQERAAIKVEIPDQSHLAIVVCDEPGHDCQGEPHYYHF